MKKSVALFVLAAGVMALTACSSDPISSSESSSSAKAEATSSTVTPIASSTVESSEASSSNTTTSSIESSEVTSSVEDSSTASTTESSEASSSTSSEPVKKEYSKDEAKIILDKIVSHNMESLSSISAESSMEQAASNSSSPSTDEATQSLNVTLYKDFFIYREMTSGESVIKRNYYLNPEEKVAYGWEEGREQFADRNGSSKTYLYMIYTGDIFGQIRSMITELEESENSPSSSETRYDYDYSFSSVGNDYAFSITSTVLRNSALDQCVVIGSTFTLDSDYSVSAVKVSQKLEMQTSSGIITRKAKAEYSYSYGERINAPEAMKASFALAKKYASIEGFSLSTYEFSLKVGESKTIVATIRPEESEGVEINWSSNNESIATVDENGKVTAIAPGTVTITASVGNRSSRCEVTVEEELDTRTDTEKAVEILKSVVDYNIDYLKAILYTEGSETSQTDIYQDYYIQSEDETSHLNLDALTVLTWRSSSDGEISFADLGSVDSKEMAWLYSLEADPIVTFYALASAEEGAFGSDISVAVKSFSQEGREYEIKIMELSSEGSAEIVLKFILADDSYEVEDALIRILSKSSTGTETYSASIRYVYGDREEAPSSMKEEETKALAWLEEHSSSSSD